MRTLLPALSLVAVAACDGSPAEVGPSPLDDFARVIPDAPEQGGCSDVFMYGAFGNSSRAILLSVRGDVAQEAADNGQPLSISYTLPHPDIDLVAQWGTELTQNLCNDVVIPGTVIDGEAPAVSGTVHLTIEPDVGYQGFFEATGDAFVELEDVAFENPATGVTRTATTSLSAYIGWLPG